MSPGMASPTHLSSEVNIQIEDITVRNRVPLIFLFCHLAFKKPVLSVWSGVVIISREM